MANNLPSPMNLYSTSFGAAFAAACLVLSPTPALAAPGCPSGDPLSAVDWRRSHEAAGSVLAARDTIVRELEAMHAPVDDACLLLLLDAELAVSLVGAIAEDVMGQASGIPEVTITRASQRWQDLLVRRPDLESQSVLLNSKTLPEDTRKSLRSLLNDTLVDSLELPSIQPGTCWSVNGHPVSTRELTVEGPAILQSRSLRGWNTHVVSLGETRYALPKCTGPLAEDAWFAGVSVSAGDPWSLRAIQSFQGYVDGDSGPAYLESLDEVQRRLSTDLSVNLGRAVGTRLTLAGSLGLVGSTAWFALEWESREPQEGLLVDRGYDASEIYATLGLRPSLLGQVVVVPMHRVQILTGADLGALRLPGLGERLVSGRLFPATDPRWVGSARPGVWARAAVIRPVTFDLGLGADVGLFGMETVHAETFNGEELTHDVSSPGFSLGWWISLTTLFMEGRAASGG